MVTASVEVSRLLFNDHPEHTPRDVTFAAGWFARTSQTIRKWMDDRKLEFEWSNTRRRYTTIAAMRRYLHGAEHVVPHNSPNLAQESEELKRRHGI